jgi:hypothetical protein
MGQSVSGPPNLLTTTVRMLSRPRLTTARNSLVLGAFCDRFAA